MTVSLSDDALAWAQSRGISAATLRMMGVASGMERFGEGKEPAIFFPYTEGEVTVNYKARCLTRKAFTQKKGGKQCFFNLDRVLNGNLDCVYIVEGEMDALALIEAGIPADSVLSVPGGAPPDKTEDPKATRRYQFVEDALRNGLSKALRFVIATDADDKGHFLRADLVAILGAAKCWFLDWPEGIKDANEMLLSDGRDDLREYVREAAKPWPIDGLYRLRDIPEPPRLELWKPGIIEWGERVQFSPTMISVGTGYPGHGKTLFAQQTWASIARQYGIKVAVMSAETRVKPHVRRNLRSFFLDRREVEMDQAAKDRADAWIDDHFVFLAHPEAAPTFGWLLDTAEAAIVRHGVRAILVDPWNKLEADYNPREMNETQWIGKCLDDLIHLAKGMNIHVQILAHPSKPDGQHKGPPTPYSISGSAHWYNRPDQIWAIHREKFVADGGIPCTEAKFFQYKTRYEELGHPCTLALRYVPDRGRYVSDEF